jgi:hypothetical protein
MSQGIIFDYYQHRQQTWTCNQCEWTGPGSALEVGEVFEALHELDCPQCHTCMGCVAHPTLKEARANWEKVPEHDKRQVKYIEKMIEEFDRLCLKSPEQLPEIASDDFVLVWDAEGGNTVIKHKGQAVFAEPIRYQDFERYEDVVGILKVRYGDSLKGVHPTPAAYENLCGDSITAGGRLKAFHAEVFGNEFK